MEQIAASGKYSHLAFATFDFEHNEFWDLVDFAADHGWTSNSFYMAHMDGNLAAVTLPGELNELPLTRSMPSSTRTSWRGTVTTCTITGWMAS